MLSKESKLLLTVEVVRKKDVFQIKKPLW